MLNKYKVTFLLAFNEVVKLKQDFIVEARDKEQANDKALKKIASNNPESIKDVKKELIPECEITRIELLERADDERS